MPHTCLISFSGSKIRLLIELIPGSVMEEVMDGQTD